MTSQVNYSWGEKVTIMGLISARVSSGEESISINGIERFAVRPHSMLLKAYPAVKRRGANEIVMVQLPPQIIDRIYDELLYCTK